MRHTGIIEVPRSGRVARPPDVGLPGGVLLQGYWQGVFGHPLLAALLRVSLLIAFLEPYVEAIGERATVSTD